MAQEIADSTLLETWGSGGNIVEPDISKIIEGWQLGEQPPHEYMNWLQNTFGSKLNHILKNGVAGWNNKTPYLAGSSVQHNGNVWLCKATNTNSAPTDANANWKRIITVESLTTVLNGYVALTGNQTITGTKTFSGLSKTSIGDNALEVITSGSNGSAGSFMVSQGVKYGLALNGSGTGLETGSFNFQVIDRDLKTVKSMPFSIGIEGVVSYNLFPVTPSSSPTTNYQVVNKKYVDDIENISSLSTKTTPVDTDNLKIQESGGLFKKLSWANLKANLFDGAMNLTINGYIKLPSIMGGIIFQWGRTNFVFEAGAGTLSNTVTFPIAFTEQVYTVLPSLVTNAPNSFNSGYGSLSLSSFVFYCSSNGAPGILNNTWFAVGR